MTSIKLFRGEFGHVSLLSVASDLVTHAHPDAHIIIWLEGDPGEMIVGETIVEPGPALAVGVNSYQPHSHRFAPDATPGLFLAFYIKPEWIARRHGKRPLSALFQSPAIPVFEQLRSMADDLYNQLMSTHDALDLADYEIERRTECLIDAVTAQSPARARPASGSQFDFRIRKAIALMRADVSGRLGLDEIARSVGLSRPHFFALFKEQTKLTPNVYWNTLRMEEALKQVQGAEESLTSVACSLGFTTQGNFTRFFRDHAGVPPTLYREAARAPSDDFQTLR
jgi:AraC family transcriptional regulator